MCSIQTERPNINFHKYYDGIFVVVKNEVYRAFLWLYKGGSQYVGDFLRTTPRGIRRLGALERVALNRRESTINFDINFLYTLLQHTCGLAEDTADIWNNPNTPLEQQSLEHSLYQLKLKRNVLSHEPQTLMQMDEVELDTSLNELRQLCRIVIQTAGQKSSRSSHEISNCLDRMEKAFDDIKARPIPSGFTSQKFAILARQEILRRNTHRPPSRNTYVMPLLHTKGRNGRYEAHLKLFPSWRSEDGTFPKKTLVSGEAGTGKSSMCLHIHDTWVSGSDEIINLKDFDLAVPVTCSSVSTRDLIGFLQNRLLKDTISSCGREETSEFLKKLRILWLIDGFDEATTDARELLKEIEKQGDAHLIFITTIPKSTDDVKNILNSNDPMYEVTLSGLSDEGIKSLTEKMFEGEEDELIKFQREVEALGGEISKELKNPLKLTLMLKLWKERKLNVSSEASLSVLYDEILRVRSVKLVDTLKSKCNLTENAVYDVVEKWIQLLCEVAFDMSITNTFVDIDDSSQKKLESGIEKHFVSADDWLSIFLQSNFTDCEGNRKYSFIHNSHQHFLAARYVCSLINAKNKSDVVLERMFKQNILSQNIMNRNHFYLILIQIASFLTKQTTVQKPLAKVLVELLSMCSDFEPFEVVKFASYSPVFVEEVSKYTNKEEWTVVDDTVKAAMKLLEFLTPLSINITIISDPSTVEILPEFLKSISNRKILIHLDLMKHAMLMESEFSDSYLDPLCTLDAKCSPVSFKGRLSAEGCRYLAKMPKLKNISLAIPSNKTLDKVLINIKHFKQIDVVSLSLQMTSINTSVSLLNVEIKNLQIGLPILDESHIDETALALSNIHRQYEGIRLCDISASAAVKIVQILEKKKVNVKVLTRTFNCSPFGVPGVFRVNYGPVPLIQPITEFLDQWNNTSIEISENELGRKELRLKLRGITQGNIKFIEIMSDSSYKFTCFQ